MDPERTPLFATWADDINSVSYDLTTLCKIIRTTRATSKDMDLPLSPGKTQLLVIYPPNYKKKRYRPGDYIEGIRLSGSIKILGLTWNQPRRLNSTKRLAWF